MADLSPLEQLLFGAIGTGMVGIGSLITWAVRNVVPKVLGMLEERNKTLVEAVQRVGKAIDEFDTTLKNESSKIVTEISASRDKVIEKITDRRMEDLEREVREVRRLSQPDDLLPSGTSQTRRIASPDDPPVVPGVVQRKRQ